MYCRDLLVVFFLPMFDLTYAADYIVLADGSLLCVGLEKVDLAEEFMLVVLELSDHDGRSSVWIAMRQEGGSVFADSGLLVDRAEIISAGVETAGRKAVIGADRQLRVTQTSHR